jgi:hypothetical protein
MLSVFAVTVHAADYVPTAQHLATLNANIVSGSPAHLGGNDPMTQGFTMSPPSHPPLNGYVSDSDANADPSGGFWTIAVDDQLGATLQRYQGQFDVPDTGSSFTMSAMGAIFANNRSSRYHRTDTTGDGALDTVLIDEINPGHHGNTMVLSLDTQAGGPTITGTWNEVIGAGGKVFAGNSPIPDPGSDPPTTSPNRSFDLDISDVHLYQWFFPNDGGNLAQLWVDGALAIDDIDVTAPGSRTGLDGNEGWLWGSVTRGREVEPPCDSVETICVGSLSSWSRVQVQNGRQIVPEPATLALVGLAGLMAVAGRRRR